MSSVRRAASIAFAWGCAGGPAVLLGQSPDSLHPRQVQVAAGARYRVGPLHRFLLGAHYRDLWAAPVTVDVLDLNTFAGGLRPTQCAGRRQTKSVRLQGADGHVYVFRSVDKDPTQALPPDLRQTFAREILQDQTSSAHPGAPLVVAPLLEATGVLHATPSLYVLPNDPRLTAFDCVSAGMLGMIEQRPTAGDEEEPGFAGAADIASTAELFDRLQRNPRDRVDARAFLGARLLDVYLGDWDRHQDQWRWARFDAAGLRWWRPIPRDRDQAFSRLDGLLIRIAAEYFPQIVGFDERYPSLFRLTLTGAVLDRRLLVELDRSVWDSTAAALQARLTDSVINQAVARLPDAYRRGSGAHLADALRRRRDDLPQAARRFYELLAAYVDIHTTDEVDSAVVDRQPDRTVVRVSTEGRSSFARAFDPRETHEIRLYLHGGADRALVRGAGAGPLLRIIGGGGDDMLVDSSTGGAVRLYDERGANRIVPGPRTHIDTRHYEQPPIDTNTLGRPRDWGGRGVPFVWVSFGPDIGLFVGGGWQHTQYGFRELPYASRTTVRAGYATGATSGRVDVLHEIRNFPGHATTTWHVRASGIDIVQFYGFGNQTSDSGPASFHKVPQQQYEVAPGVTWGSSTRAQVSVGVIAKDVETRPDSTRLIGIVRPYGTGSFQQIGATAGLQVDTRDRAAWATRGVHLTVSGSVYPGALDVRRAFTGVTAQAATYLTVPHGPTAALRLGGSRVFGTYPFSEAASVGGATTLRGFAEHRFAGDAALWANAELRASFGHAYVLMPVEFGAFGLADAGRVFLSGEQSDVWHGAVGGGLWFAFLNRTNTLVITAARSVERTAIYVRAGFTY